MFARVAASLLLLAAALFGAFGAGRAAPPPLQQTAGTRPLTIHQLDVGQGDAALLTTPNGRRILIDAGRTADDVAAMLAAAGVDTIDLVIASHNHADHIGGMAQVLETFAVRAYIENGIPQPTATYHRTLAALEAEPGLMYLRATERTIAVGPVFVRILAVPGVDNSQNNNSVGVLIDHGAFRALYTGDSEVPELTGWLRRGVIPRVTVVKVAHHGSRNGTTADLVRTTSPAIAIISVGAGNSYGHPSPQAELQWSAAGARILRTDLHGTIEILAFPDGRFTTRTHFEPASRR